MGRELFQTIGFDTSYDKLGNEPAVYVRGASLLDLRDEIAKSEIGDDAVETLQRYSAGVMDAVDFSEEWQRLRGEGQLIEENIGYALGLATFGESMSAGRDTTLSDAANEAFSLMGYKKGYEHHGIAESVGMYTPAVYLEEIVSTGRPIVFFVPQNIYTHVFSNVTRREFQWLLKKADKGVTRNMYFVFGLQTMFDQETLAMMPGDKDTKTKQVASILRDPQKHPKRKR